MREIRGTRYAVNARQELVDFTSQRLHALDYTEIKEFYRDVVPDLTRSERALLGCNDRYYLLTCLLGRVDAFHPWLFARCREVEEDPDGFLDLWAREHYKSTIITFAGIIQEVMIDPELTVGIFSVTRDIAKAFLRQIKEEFERNDELKAIYRDVLWERPARDAPTWSVTDGIVVQRRSNPKEATIEAWGLLDGMPVGRHFALRDYDDVVTEKTVTNEDQQRKTIERWELSDNLGAGDNRIWVPGTRYHFGDAYGVMLDRGVLKPRIYPATDNGRLDGAPVFFTEEKWQEKKRTQRSTLAAQLLQNPIAGKENSFETSWLRFYVVRPRVMNVYIMADPSMGHSNKSDRTAIAVIGVDHLGNKYLLDGYRHRMKLTERWMALKGMHKKWNNAPGVMSVQVGYERYGMQADMEHFAEEMRKKPKESFAIKELNWVKEGSQAKTARVNRMEPDFREGSFFVPAKVWHPDYGVALWEVWNDEREEAWRDAHDDKPSGNADGMIVYRHLKGALRHDKVAIADGERYRIADPIRRLDEDGNVYDLTRMFFEEYSFFPFAAKDDLVDAMSRIEDMEPAAPNVHEAQAVEMPLYAD